MKNTIFLLLLAPLSSLASVMGISTHPLNEEARVLSAEMKGHMAQRHEMSLGLRYTQEVDYNKLLDVSASGGQHARGLHLGAGMDFTILNEEMSQPRFSLKPFYQYQKYETERFNLLGVAPSLRKGFSLQGQEVFPYVALPAGIKINSANDKYVYSASVAFGASMPIPTLAGNKLLISIEGNRDLGASSDYVGALLSWVWK